MVSATLGLLLLLGVQLHVVGASHAGGAVPDPSALLAAFAGLVLPARQRLAAAVGLGWARALVLAEPAGGAILCAWAAASVVAGQRDSLGGMRVGSLLGATLLGALTWMGAAWLLRSVQAATVSADLGLLTGALLAVPVAGLARRAGRALGRAT